MSKASGKSVCVVGLGYIGLPSASLLAHTGFQVIGVDINPDVVETLNKGRIHITEPDLEFSVKSAVEKGLLRAVTKPQKADIYLIAVPTPFRDDHKPDLSYVESAVDSIASVLTADCLVILESTSPVGTTERISSRICERRPDLEPGSIDVAYCPERVLPGQILRELVENERVVGGVTERAAVRAREFYQTFVRGSIHLTNSRTAELVKLSENAFRDVNIAFANELSLVCSKLGIDVWKVREFANRHPRVNILSPGPGVGGHCIAVDPWFIVASCPEETPLMRTARGVNDRMPHHVVEQISKLVEQSKKAKPTISLLGLSYKPNIDDIRESPAMEVVKLASNLPARVIAVEPYLSTIPTGLKNLGVEEMDFEAAIEIADIVVLLVDHNAFKTLNLKTLEHKLVLDTRGIWKDLEN